MYVDTVAECERVIRSGERLLWSGVPSRVGVFRSSDLLLVPFSLMWGGFAVFWETMVIRQHGPFFMKLWGIPFVVIGVYLMCGRFFVSARALRSTVYAVTSERVLVIGGLWRRVVHSHPLHRLSAARLEEFGDGTATITLNPESIPSPWQRRNMSWSSWHSWSPFRLERISEGKRVYDLIMSKTGRAGV